MTVPESPVMPLIRIACRTKLHRLLRLAGIVLLLAIPATPRAQMINYGELEQLFGEPVTTSVTGKPQRASEVPGNLTIITQDDIRRSGATTIPDILQFVPGVDVRHNWLGDAQVAMRGYNSPMTPRLLVLVNGRQVYLDDYGYVAWNALPVQMSEIRQIEVVKGPNTALFGFNAAAGVVNIITTDPLRDSINTATVLGGTQAYGEANIVTTAHLGSTAGLRVSAGGWTANEFHTAPANAGLRYPRAANLTLDARWQIDPDLLLRAEASLTDALSPRVTPVAVSINTQVQTNSLRLGAAATTKLGLVDIDVYRNAGTYEYSNPATGGGPARNIVTVARLGHLLKLGATHTLRTSLDYRNNSDSADRAIGGTIAYDDYAASIMWDWQISPTLSLNNAARFDHLALHYSGNLLAISGRTFQAFNATRIDAASFNTGLVYRLTGSDTLRLTFSRGLQLPSLLDYGLQAPVGRFTLLGSPALMPTVVWNAELGLDIEIESLASTLGAAVFVQRNVELLGAPGSTAPGVAGGVVYSQADDIGSSDEVGFEWGLRGRSEAGMRWNASYRFASISDDIPAAGVKTPSATTRYRNGTPQHSIILGAGATLGRFELDGQIRWQSAYTDYHVNADTFAPFVIPNNVTVNGRVGYALTDSITLAATLQRYTVARLLAPNFGSGPQLRAIASVTAHF